MAAPVVTLEVSPTSLPASGGTVSIKINAHDPDTGAPAADLRFTGSGKSSDGQTGTFELVVRRAGVPGDSIVGYSLVCDDPAVRIVQSPTDPSRFTATVPPAV